MTGQEQGYWAGTTTADRARMLEQGQRTVAGADEQQARVRAAMTADRDGVDVLHEPGQGSYWWYRRRGCRCGQCRAANAAQRAAERAKAKGGFTVAA